MSLSLPLLVYEVCVVGKLAAAHTPSPVSQLWESILTEAGCAPTTGLCLILSGRPMLASLLSGWDLCLLGQEAVTAPSDTGSYSPGDRCTLPPHQIHTREPRSFSGCLCPGLVGLVRPDSVVGSDPLCCAVQWGQLPGEVVQA